jgi:hypothetical protein
LHLALLFSLACQPEPEDTGADASDDSGDASDTSDSSDASDTSESDSEPAWEPDASCDWLDLSVYAVQCGDVTPSRLTEWVSASGDAACPAWYEIEGHQRPTAEEALTAAGCDRTCVYRMHQAVMLLYCDVRGEYVTYLPDGPGQDGDGATCPELAEFHTVAGSGWYPNLDAYAAEHPCPSE